jgi:hypothetical protein
MTRLNSKKGYVIVLVGAGLLLLGLLYAGTTLSLLSSPQETPV